MNLKNLGFDKYKLAENSYQIENKYLKENVGIQDQIASSFGNLNYVKIKKDKTFKINPIILKDHERWSCEFEKKSAQGWHREKAAKPFEHNAIAHSLLVARPVSRTEFLANPKAMEAYWKELQNLEQKGVWR